MDRVRRVLADDHTTLAEDYFRTEGDGSRWFSGSAFEDPSVFGDNDPLRITPEDLLAVTTLSVSVPPHEVVKILTKDADSLMQMLRDIPTDASPESPLGRAALAEGGSAATLWADLKARPGIGWVTAGKMCARKRPMLIPVYDRVVKETLDPPDGRWWESVVAIFGDADARRDLEALAARLGRSAGHPVTPLRSLDIAVWMRQYGYPWVPTRGAVQPLILA